MGDLKQKWRDVRPSVVSGVAYAIVRLVNSTIRTRLVNPPAEGTSAIICGWHGKSFLFADRFRNRGFGVIISHSKDGEIQASIFRRLGYRVIRGSTGRGGVRAAVEGIRLLREGGSLAMTPDGPRGPSGVVQGGVMLMAQKSGALLVPVGIVARPCWRIEKSWDRYMVPMPFGRGLMVFGDGIAVPADANEEAVEEIRVRFEQEIHRLEAEAERQIRARD